MHFSFHTASFYSSAFLFASASSSSLFFSTKAAPHARCSYFLTMSGISSAQFLRQLTPRSHMSFLAFSVITKPVAASKVKTFGTPTMLNFDCNYLCLGSLKVNEHHGMNLYVSLKSYSVLSQETYTTSTILSSRLTSL